MPRIATDRRFRNAGSVSIDYCRVCYRDAVEAVGYGERPPGVDRALNAQAVPVGSDCGGFSLDVEHPPYESTDYTCIVCGNPLRHADDTPGE